MAESYVFCFVSAINYLQDKCLWHGFSD